MSNPPGNTTKRKVSIQEKSQKTGRTVTGLRQVSRESLEPELTRKIIEKNSTKLSSRTSSSKNIIKKKDSTDRIRETIVQGSSSKTVKDVAKNSSTPRVPTSSSSTKSKKPGESEKRGVSSIYMPKKSSSIVKKTETKIKEPIVSTSRTKESSGSRQRVSSKERRRRSRTLSPSEVKMLHKIVKSTDKNKIKRDPSPDFDYEDDFEDYESDFQDCTDESEASEVSETSNDSSELVELEPIELQSSKVVKYEKKTIDIGNGGQGRRYDEEQMLDSGNYELQEARRRAARLNIMSANNFDRKNINEIKKTNDNNYVDEKIQEVNSRSLLSSADEGFEDGRSGDFASKLINESSTKITTQQDVVVNNNNNNYETVKKIQSRGQQLLQMIKLDTVEWSIYEATPVQYEEFISLHGKINTRQIATQTNDDCLNVEVQTDEIKYRDMWSQFPIKCTNNLKTEYDVEKFKKEAVGVGCDYDNNSINSQPYYDVLQLNEFLENAGKVILALLEEKNCQINTTKSDSENLKLPFSDVTIKLKISMIYFLVDRPVTMIRYSEKTSQVILTIHAPSDEEVEVSRTEENYITDCCIGCQWNIFEPSRPMKIFYSSSNITASCFHPTNCNIIFAGLEDGSLSLWDLSEHENHHRKIIDKNNEAEWIIRCPTFSTSAHFDYHDNVSKIVGISVLSKIETDSNDSLGKFMPIQICSLDEEGKCRVWSVLRNLTESTTVSHDLGQSWWGKIRLVPSQNIQLSCDKVIDQGDPMKLNFNDISVDTVDTNSLYIATSTSKVLRATRTGKKLKPHEFDGHFTGAVSTTCIEYCPFGQPYFLVGCTDGTIRVHNSTMERPVLQLSNLKSSASIKIIQWSRSKPLTIFALDDESRIHLWDLGKSDIIPMASILPDKSVHISSIQLSPCKNDYDMANQYMTLGLENGTVEIHKFKSQYCHQQRDDLSSELKILLHYLAVH